ncbi:MAG TPA: o-succinylbenzoate synthase [Longimicrobiales bacterium]|nr:o-succinylbenzoate synthase [Longimicrobiales bacterium]
MRLEVERIELREVRLPLKEPFRISSGVMDTKRALLVRLEQDGVSAWSECAALSEPNYIPDTVDTSWLALTEWLVPRFLQSSLSPEEVSAELDRNLRGHRMAKAALEMGGWDLSARLQGVSLSRLLGGDRDRVATGISLGIQADPGALAERVSAAVADGYRRIKVKIKPGRDYDYLAAARDAAGDVPVMADANSAYTLDDTESLRRLDALDLLMIEQPLAWDDLPGHAHLQQELETPICLDECVATPRHAETMIELDAGRIINIKPGRVGGFTPSREIHDLCQRNGLAVWCGGMLETGIGRGHNVALASLPNFTMAGDLSPSSRYWERDIVRPGWEMTEPGYLDVPSGPGFGVEVDTDYIDDLTDRAITLRRP